MIRIVLAAASVLLAGCTAATTGTATHTAAATAAPVRSTAGPVGAQLTCGRAFPDQVVRGWMASTVGELRAYHHGGPTAKFPIRSAFSGVPTNHPGAWCMVGQGVDTTGLWAAVDGIGTQLAITLTGPGEGNFRGELRAVPQPP
ncbi:hypothetical protein BH10ACT8_BH10ACT8_28990 [soil metagenome]